MFGGYQSDPLYAHFEELKQILFQFGLNFRISLICNEEFKEKIYNVVTALFGSVADTSELFMRSIQMSNLFANDAPKSGEVVTKQRTAGNDGTRQIEEKEIKISLLIKSSLVRLVGNDLLPTEEIGRLQKADYSKRAFNINYPILKLYDENSHILEQRNINGYPRYYSDLYTINDQRYLLFNHWVEEQSRSGFRRKL